MKNPSFLIAFFATIVRYYDYALFGLSASVLSKNFMPPNDSEHQILCFFMVFSIAFIARPIGSIIFGRIGDNYGRAKSAKIAAFLAAISTSLIAIIPDFSQIGIFATLILIIARMLFLLSLSGEIDSIRIYITEKTGPNKNLAGGFVSFSSQVGALLAATAYHYAISSDAEYLWRINFIIGGFGGVLVIFMRGYFKESLEFLQYKVKIRQNKASHLGFFQVIKDIKIKFILALLINGCCGGIYHFLVIFLGTFLSKIAIIISADDAQIMNINLIIIYAIMSILAGFLGDRINLKKQILYSLSLSLLIIFIMFICLLRNIYPIYLIYIIMSFVPLYVIPLQILVQSMFTIGIKMRMYSLSHSLGGLIFSGTSPLICMLLWRYSGSLTLIFSFFIILLITLLSSVIYMFYNDII